MNEFEKIMHKLKMKTNIKSDAKIAELLGISKGNYSERKGRNSIPHEKILEICKINKISIDYLYDNEEKENDFQKMLIESVTKLNEKEAKYFHYLIESKLAEKELNK